MYQSFSRMSVILSRQEDCMLCLCVEAVPRMVLRSRLTLPYLKFKCGHIYCKSCIESMVKVRIRKCSFCRCKLPLRLNQLFVHEKVWRVPFGTVFVYQNDTFAYIYMYVPFILFSYTFRLKYFFFGNGPISKKKKQVLFLLII